MDILVGMESDSPWLAKHMGERSVQKRTELDRGIHCLQFLNLCLLKGSERGRETERKAERDIIHLLVYSGAYNTQCWAG